MKKAKGKGIDKIKQRKKYIISGAFFLVLLAAIIISTFSKQPNKIKVEYTIKPYSVNDKLLNVNVKITPEKSWFLKPFVLVKGSLDTSNEKCTDDLNRDVKFGNSNGIIIIDKLSDDGKSVNYSYDVRIANPAKHGNNGQIYDNMLTFQGESVMTLPYRAVDDQNSRADIVKKITIQYLVPGEWSAIVPYEKKGTENITEVENPTAFNLYEIRKSAYTFGKFKKDEHMDLEKGYTVYIDPEAEKYYDSDAKRGIESLYKYYSKLFNLDLDNYSIILLRKDGKDQNYILGGSGTENIASTFDPKSKRDWQLMGHRLFHAFFESKINPDRFLKAPLLSFHEGLATYYENMSMNALPEDIKNKLDIYPDKEFSYLFERYVYMKLKDTQSLSLAPLNEIQIQQSPAKIEFLHYTQMPLTIKYMEDLISEKTKTKDNILKYVINNSGDNTITVEKIANNLLGKDAKDFINKYFSGSEIMPLWSSIENRNETDKDVLRRLNQYEYDLYTWFRLEDPLYRNDDLAGDNLIRLSNEADKQGANFSDKAAEVKVKGASPTIYNLLKEYALRAKICSVDYNDANLRDKLLSNQINLDKWDTFMKSLK